MDKQPAFEKLVRNARQGDEKSLNELAEAARKRLCVYVYRLTLDDDLSQEITQESLLEMFRILGKLKDCDKFWPWLYGIATNKLHRHHRTEQKFKRLAEAKAERTESPSQRQEGFERLVGTELKEIVASAMEQLSTRHRAVLIMRCYDSMSYADIARSMNTSEFGTRMLFMRAKKSLQKHLLRNGFGRKALIPALILFGKMTAPSEAAAAKISITAATTGVGVTAGVVGLATSKTAIVSVAAAGLLTAGSIVATSGPGDGQAGRAGSSIEGVTTSSMQSGQQNDQCWYYFPQGPEGPVMMRAKAAFEPGSPNQWLQDDVANYLYSNGTIYITNARVHRPDLSVMRLPVDDADLRRFLTDMDGVQADMGQVTGGGNGLLVVATRGAEGRDSQTWAVRHSNVLDEDYFQSDWPTDARTIDDRDTMHRIGWAGFSVSGDINGVRVSGEGRIPLVYATSGRYRPFLRLRLGSAQIADDGVNACVYRDNTVVGRYAGGTFLKGLSRPWMGLHTIDTVRRDAAGYRLAFTTERMKNTDDVDDGEYARVTVEFEGGQLIYTVDLDNDFVRQIEFTTDGERTGQLTFTYDQQSGRSVSSVSATGSAGAPYRSIQTLWLTRLGDGSLVE